MIGVTQQAKQKDGAGRWRWLVWVALAVVVLVAAVYGIDKLLNQQALARYPARGAFVTVNGASMHYLCEGQGEPTLVLVSGFGADLLDWTPLIDDLAVEQRVCAFDRLGQGWSDPMPPGPRTLADAASELNIALTSLGIENPVVVGHSLGGAVVQIYAGSYPTSGVVLVDGLTADVAEPVVARMGSYQSLNWAGALGWLRPLGFMLAPPPYEDRALLAEMRSMRGRSTAILQMAVEGEAAAAGTVAELAAAEAGGLYDVPLLVVAAGATHLVPDAPVGAFAEAQAALAERHPDATYHLIADSHHYPHATYSDDVARYVTDWLAGLE